VRAYGGDQAEFGGERVGGGDSGEMDDAVFEGLAEHLQGVASEFRQFV
jgi:hypothetical protein